MSFTSALCADLLLLVVRQLNIAVVERCDGEPVRLEWSPAGTCRALRDVTALVVRERALLKPPTWSILSQHHSEYGLGAHRTAGCHDPMWAISTEYGLLVAEYGRAELKLILRECDEQRTKQLEWRPTGLACRGDVAWVGSDCEHCVHKISLPDLAIICRSDTEYEVIQSPSEARKPGVFARVFGIAVWDDRLFVTDADNGRIVVLDAETLGWRGSFGTRGRDYGCLSEPTGVTIFDDPSVLCPEPLVLVCDHGNECLSFFQASGHPAQPNAFIEELYFPPSSEQGMGLSRPWDVAYYNGRILVCQEPHPFYRGMHFQPFDLDYKYDHSQLVVMRCDPWEEVPIPDVQQVLMLPRESYAGNRHLSLRGTVASVSGYLRPGFLGVTIDHHNGEAVVVDSFGSIHGLHLARPTV